METSGEPRADAGNGGFDRGWEGHQRRQATLGLALTPAERLRWLEQTMRELRGILGRARDVERARRDTPSQR